MKEKILQKIILLIILCSLNTLHASDVTITVNAASPIRTIPMTLYGANLASWDWHMDGTHPEYTNLLKASGCKYLRVPGGSWGNGVLWSDIEGPNGSQGWKVSYNEYLYLMSLISQPGEEVPPTLQPIVNFPGWWYEFLQDDTPTDNNNQNYAVAHTNAVNAAVAWVQDQSSRPVCAKYWEIGNEIGGCWEVGWFQGISGTFYGDYLADFSLAMKAVNPDIKIGAVAVPFNEYHNGYACDYVGYWDHDLLLAAMAKGVVPDFFIIHSYQNGGGDGGASNNPTFLGSQVNDIAQWTSNMNSIVQNTIGSQYVGQIEYCMTEWNAGGATGYDRPSCYVNAMFRAQYILEMAKHKWTVSNPWIADYDGNFRVFPVWYINPLLINYFGRDMVTASSSNSLVRAYSAKDANGNLTIFIVNNSPTASLTADISISGFLAGAGGQRWLVEPAGSIISGGINIQDKGDISINGVVHPNPLTVSSLSSQSVISGNNFTVTLPASCMLLLRVPDASGDTTPPAAPTGLSATAGEGMVSLGWDDNNEPDLFGYYVYRSTTSGSGYVKLNQTFVSSSDYTDNDIVDGTTYYYIVTAVDGSYNESDDCNEVSATPTDSTAPAAPTGLSAAAGNATVSLDWNDNNAPDLEGYNVYRSITQGSGYAKINGSLVPSSAYIDNNVVNGTTYYYVVTALDGSANESGNSTEVSATPSPTAAHLPYPGPGAHPIPGRIQAEDYDSGGEGLAYHDTTSGNSGGKYRSDNVDVETCGEGGYDVGWIQIGEWLEYTVDVASAGNYYLEVRVASQSGGSLHIEFGGVNKTGTLSFTATGGWQTWKSIYASDINLSAGQQFMRISMDSSDWNINWVHFSTTPIPRNCTEVHTGGYGLAADLNGDCYVDLSDLKVVAYYWLYTNCGTLDNCEGADFEPVDGIVNIFDFADFASQYKQCNNPEDVGCIYTW